LWTRKESKLEEKGEGLEGLRKKTSGRGILEGGGEGGRSPSIGTGSGVGKRKGKCSEREKR